MCTSLYALGRWYIYQVPALAMRLYKRGKYYQFEFRLRGKYYRKSTKFTKKEEADNYASAFRTKLVNTEVGIEEKPESLTLKEFAQQFIDHIQVRHAEKPETRDFYAKKLKQLLKYARLREAKLDRIDEGMIERFVEWRSKSVSPASVNRELATLRRMLHLAKEWKSIPTVPKVRLLAGEKQREFVLSHEAEQRYLAAAPQPLKDVATVLLDAGLRLGEALRLQWPDVHFDPAGSARYGWLQVREGKSKNARRTVPLTGRVAAALKSRKAESKSRYVFPGDDPDQPILGTSLAHMHIKVCRPGSGKKRRYVFPAEFVLHSCRHTFCTRLGESGCDSFTIMRLAGHSGVTVSQRYVHPTPEAVERAFDRLEALNRQGYKGAISGKPLTEVHTTRVSSQRKSLKGL
jgi:integrase